MLMLIVGLAAVFGGVILGLMAFGVVGAERGGVQRSLAAIEAISSAPESMRRELDAPFGDRVLSPLRDAMVRLGRRFTPSDYASRVRHRLDLAGNPAGWDVDRVLAFKVLGAVVGVLLGLAVPLLLVGNLLWAVVGAAVGLFAGFNAVSMWIYQVGYNRSERIRRDLPDALDLLTVSVEAGLGFDAALGQVARNTEGPLAEEFFRVLQEMQIGTGRSDALRALGDRTDVQDLRLFLNAMVQADAFGIPIAQVLRVQSHEMRLKRSQRAEEMAQKVPVKILFPLIFCIMPALFVVIIGPAAVTLAQTFSRI
jgi:tight adherence protein C